MNFLLGIIPLQYRIIAKYIAYLILALSCAFGGHYITKKHYQPKVELLQVQVKQFEEAYNTLAELTNKQNAAILDLQKQGIAKQKKAEIVLEKARKDSAKFGNEANGIMLIKPKNADTCKEASILIDSELTKERNHD